MGIDALTTNRDFRFHTAFSNLYLQALPIRPGMKILDLGCGPGSFTRCVSDWLEGKVDVYGLDLDDGYIEYCRREALLRHYNISYTVGDACRTPFPENHFDLTVSFTVAQHVDNTLFFKEQYRVLKNGGWIVLMDIAENAISLENQYRRIPRLQREDTLFRAIEAYWGHNRTAETKSRFNQHTSTPHEKIERLTEVGFHSIRLQKLKLFACPDNPQPDEFARLIIENFYCWNFNLANMVLHNDRGELIRYLATKYLHLLDERREKRIHLYEDGIKLWDSIETEIHIVTAQKS